MASNLTQLINSEVNNSTGSLETISSGDSDQSLGEWLADAGLQRLQEILNENGIHDMAGLTLDAHVNNLPFLTTQSDRDAILQALRGADLNQDCVAMPQGSMIDSELDDLLGEFIDMEADLDKMLPVRQPSLHKKSSLDRLSKPPLVQLREKKENTAASNNFRMSIMALGNSDEQDLDSLLDDLYNDVDLMNSSYGLSKENKSDRNQFDSLSVLPPPLSVSTESLPPPPLSFSSDDEAVLLPPSPHMDLKLPQAEDLPLPPTDQLDLPGPPPASPLPPPPASPLPPSPEPNLDEALDDLEFGPPPPMAPPPLGASKPKRPKTPPPATAPKPPPFKAPVAPPAPRAPVAPPAPKAPEAPSAPPPAGPRAPVLPPVGPRAPISPPKPVREAEPTSPSVDDLLDQLVAPPPPPIRASSPLPAPPPPCNDYNDAPRPKSMGADSDIRNSICTTSSGTSSRSTNSMSFAGNQRQSLNMTPHSTLSKSSGISSCLSDSSSSELYSSKMSLASSDYTQNDFKTDPLNVPIRRPDTEPFILEQQNDATSPTTPITPGPKNTKIQRRLTMILKESEKENLTEAEKGALLKKEKLKIALEKLRVASNLKIAMKAYNVNGSSKTIFVEQKQSAWEICQVLTEKNHFKLGADWTLVEHISDLKIERELQDHENVYDVLNSWSRDTTNKMIFKNNARKYELFRRPQLYLFPEDSYANVVDLSRECRDLLIDDFFSETATTRIPSIGLKGIHYLKSGKRSWRKMNFIIRDSGIYYAAKSKNKSTALPWSAFARISENDILIPADSKDFKKTHKAPTDYCFLIRSKGHSREDARSTRCICVENELQFRLWTNALRRLSYGIALKDNNTSATTWLDQVTEETQIERAMLSPTLQKFTFGADRESIYVPELDDENVDIFSSRFGSAWDNGSNNALNAASSMADIPMETDTQGMTMVRLHR